MTAIPITDDATSFFHQFEDDDQGGKTVHKAPGSAGHLRAHVGLVHVLLPKGLEIFGPARHVTVITNVNRFASNTFITSCVLCKLLLAGWGRTRLIFK
jgi:hypothetical protein